MTGKPVLFKVYEYKVSVRTVNDLWVESQNAVQLQINRRATPS